MRIVTVLSCLLPFMVACESHTQSQVIEQPHTGASTDRNADMTQDQHIQFTAEVVYKDLEGGFYALIAKDGSKYQPLALAQAYRRHGLVVKVEAKPIKDRVTFQQFGTVVEIISISVLDDSKVRSSKNTH
ncbi:hypothetical protein [Lacimicrobium sp. SS2-24]|uniref:hypothetical protein n=1 Tax=Lacimicrobium sp. SS2-24 TaxID=2005569 RepID=UPI000B4A9AB2|nr:hypothetical protein [Lacimicrobium sp. SS2-24]